MTFVCGDLARDADIQVEGGREVRSDSFVFNQLHLSGMKRVPGGELPAVRMSACVSTVVDNEVFSW